MEEARYYEKEDLNTKYYYKVVGNVVWGIYGNKNGMRYGINMFQKLYDFHDCTIITQDKFDNKLELLRQKLSI